MKNWYESWFSRREYLDLYKHRDRGDASKAVKLITSVINLKPGSEVLDVACGNGRHSILLARKGYNTTGIDLSSFLISEAKKLLNKNYRSLRPNLHFRIMDMRKIKWKNRFDLAVNLFTSFGYFDSNRENKSALKGIASSLRKGGYFFLDFINQKYLRANLNSIDIKKGNRNIMIQVRTIAGDFVRKDIIVIRNNPRRDVPFLDKFYEQIRLYSYGELRKMLSESGLKVIEAFGDYSGNTFDINKSQRLILLARKK